MQKIKPPEFLGKICVVTGGFSKGTVCMPNEMSFERPSYSYSCLTVNVKDKTVDIEDEFAWVAEEDLELHTSIKNLDGFQFLYDEED